MRDFIKYFLQEKTKITPIIGDKKVKSAFGKSHPPHTIKEYPYSETFFDFEGNKKEYKSYHVGKIVVWEKFNYDHDGKLIETLERKTDHSGNRYSEKHFQFVPKKLNNSKDEKIEKLSEDGQKFEITNWGPGKIKSRRLFNENDFCIELTEFSINGALTNKRLYDPHGQLLEARRFRSDGIPLNYTINTYNEKSLLCRSLSISRTGHKTHDVVLKYNQDGLLAEYIDYPIDPENAFADLKDASNGFSHKYSYTQDRLMETDSLYLCGELIMTYKYTYQFW
jgi:hypothetical protein